MSQHRIVCTEQEPANCPPKQAHIVAVGVGNSTEKANQRLVLQEVLLAMDKGETFYTVGERSQKVALVEKYMCSYCRRTHIRSKPDAVQDNNLDSLRYCRWSPN